MSRCVDYFYGFWNEIFESSLDGLQSRRSFYVTFTAVANIGMEQHETNIFESSLGGLRPEGISMLLSRWLQMLLILPGGFDADVWLHRYIRFVLFQRPPHMQTP